MGRFDEHRRLHQPVWGELDLPGIALRSLLESSSVNAPRLDDLRVFAPSANVIRFAVCDPALGLIDSLPVARDAGQRALDALAGIADLDAAFASANALLYRPGASRSTTIALSCLAAVDWDPATRELTAQQAGDCQVLVRTGNRWVSLFDDEIFTPSAKAAWAHAAPQRNRPAHLADHDRILGHPDAWLSAPLGQFERAICRRANASGVDAVAIASDGITLDENAVTDLHAAWERLHDRSEDWPHNEPHGDIAILIAELI